MYVVTHSSEKIISHGRVMVKPNGNMNHVGLEAAGVIVITVTDAGPGMTLDELSKLFQEGMQFNPNKLQAGQGSGLGLWISKGIMQLHGGSISATSEGRGRGSSFSIVLPLLRCGNNTALDIENSQRRTFVISESNVQEMKIPRVVLIVDDTITNVKMMKHMLKLRHIELIEEANNGSECIKLMMACLRDAPKYDLIIMDFEMPIMNGPETVQKIRSLGFKVPVIGVTGNTLGEDIDYFLSCGADAVLSKPISIEVILNTYNDIYTLRSHSVEEVDQSKKKVA
jgi:CheY-like chemotaxis protein